MLVAFVMWSAVAVLFLGIGCYVWRARKAVGFFAGETPEVKNVKSYNRAVGKLWMAGAVLMEGLGVPFLFGEQNSLVFLLPVLGTVALVIGMMVVYTRVETKYRA